MNPLLKKNMSWQMFVHRVMKIQINGSSEHVCLVSIPIHIFYGLFMLVAINMAPHNHFIWCLRYIYHVIYNKESHLNQR